MCMRKVLMSLTLVLLIHRGAMSQQLGGYFTVPIAGTPHDVVYDAGRDLAYVSNRSANQIEVVSLLDNSLRAPIAVGRKPTGMALTPDGSQLLVCLYDEEAIGVVDESGVGKSGKQTVGVGRQWLGSKGKVDNGVVGVHLSYAAPGFQCLLDSRLYLPKSWAHDNDRRKKTTYPRMWSFTQNRKSLWNLSIMPWPMESRWQPGHSTSCMAATASFWTDSSSVGRRSWARFPSTTTDGFRSLRSCKKGRKPEENGGGRRDIRVGHVGV